MEYFSNQKISMFVKYLKGLAMDEGGIFTYGHLVYFTAIWYISWLFGIFFPVLVCCINNNLAILDSAVWKLSATDLQFN
jgi:hypothetical protein